MGGRQSRDRPGVETDGAATRGTSTSSPPPPKSPSAPATSAVLAPSTRASSSSGRKPSNRLGPEDTVVIAGGGISGLASRRRSRVPEASRPKVIVMERDASAEARRQGYGVTLSETNAALAGLGILEDLRASNTRSCAHWTFKDDGSVLGYFGLAFLPEERKPKRDRLTNLRVPRNRVREILLARLLPERCGSGAASWITKRFETEPNPASSS